MLTNKDSLVTYETALKAEKYLLIVHSTQDEVTRTKNMLSPHPKVEVDVHQA